MTTATKSEYTAATTAASVGVKTPKRRPTRMISGSISAQPAWRNASQTSPRERRGGGTMCSLRTSHHQVVQSAPAIRMPGKMPARKSLLIDRLAATPKITKPIEGGMIGPITPAAAIRPPERALSWPAATIIGISRAESAAASATAEPESAESTQAATMAT